MATGTHTARTRRHHHRAAWERGQTLVEFALIIPIFLLLLLATIEFAFMFNAVLSANYATRNASLVATEAGSSQGADCVVIASVMADMTAPVDGAQVTQIIIYRANPAGNPYGGSFAGAGNVWNHTGTVANPSGTTDCSAYGGSATVPFAMATTNYAEGVPNLITGVGGRCAYLNGCPTNTLRSRDAVGVQVTYQYKWHTPLGNFLPLGGSGITIIRSNEMRMEPIL